MRSAAKTLANLVALLLALPAVAMYRLLAAVLGREKAFPGWSQAMCLIPGLPGIYLRRAFYRLVLPSCGEDACLGFGSVFSHPTARVGSKVYVGVFCSLGDVTLEDDVLVASHVAIANGGRQHGIDRLDIPIREQPGEWPHVTIGRDTWIGDRAVVLTDVGRHCVIGAGSVVTRPVPDYAIAVGNPARVIRSRLAQGESGDSRPVETQP
jgi:acetyltransferase-like isoleucine patch superfamily enzyme